MPADPEAVDRGQPPSRPRLLPRTSRQRLCLALLLGFTLVKGLIWGVTVPYFWGPDEDYHFLYAERIAVEHKLPDPDAPLYPREYWNLQLLTNYDEFCCGPRKTFSGDPKASVHALANVPRADRVGSTEGRGVGVVHPPLFYGAAAGVDAALGDASLITRIQLVRFVAALFGALAVWFAWILAAQVLRRFREQAFAAFLVAVQPVFSYLTGIVNHDTALIAFSTAALAQMLFMLRTRPRAAQGAWLGGALVLALMVKGSALALLPLAGLTYLGQWLTWRPDRRELLRSAALAFGLALVLAGWWYIRAKIVYGSFTGAATPYTTGGSEPGVVVADPVGSLSNYLHWVQEWIGLAYRSYWFHYLWFDGPGPDDPWYRIPIGFGSIGALGLGVAAWTRRRRLFSLRDPLPRQMLLVGAAVLVVMLPFLAVDVVRRSNGEKFILPGGRYLMPVFPAVAALYVAGLCQLFRERARTAALVIVGIAALILQWRVYEHYWVKRYFGDFPWGELLKRLSFDRPEFVAPTSLKATALVTLALLAGFALTLLAPDRGERRAR